MMADQKGEAMKTYIIKTRNGSKLYTAEQIIENAKEQERSGIRPVYAWRDYKTGEPSTPSGWLIWSTLDGCGVVYRRKSDGKYIIVTGWQGDFCIA